MSNPYGAPEIGAAAVDEMRKNGASFVWLDVREPFEQDFAAIDDERIMLTPMSDLAQRQLDALPEPALDKEGPIIVMCHHGIRSAQVVVWLRQQGWTNVLNLGGGIDAWAQEVDRSVGVY